MRRHLSLLIVSVCLFNCQSIKSKIEFHLWERPYVIVNKKETCRQTGRRITLLQTERSWACLQSAEVSSTIKLLVCPLKFHIKYIINGVTVTCTACHLSKITQLYIIQLIQKHATMLCKWMGWFHQTEVNFISEGHLKCRSSPWLSIKTYPKI